MRTEEDIESSLLSQKLTSEELRNEYDSIQVPLPKSLENHIVDSEYNAPEFLNIFRIWQSLEKEKADFDSSYIRGHGLRVANYVHELGKLLVKSGELTESRLEALTHAALIHDIGRTHDELLDLWIKIGLLTDEEKKRMEKHSEYGRDMIRAAGISEDIAEIVYQHHERINGSGYPRKLKGDKVSVEAQLLSIADAFDAITTRNYYFNGNGYHYGAGIGLTNGYKDKSYAIGQLRDKAYTEQSFNSRYVQMFSSLFNDSLLFSEMTYQRVLPIISGKTGSLNSSQNTIRN